MRTVHDVITDLESSGFLWHVLRFESLAQFIDRVEDCELVFLTEWIDSATRTFNDLLAYGALTIEDQMLLYDWIIECQTRAETAMKERQAHV